ncbi:uncharacterized protein LOC132200959 [Neocloeon triangulifer]|uniref:uncharacterized protein LOC132200959 n=1 Tax=Neocloeon triangulifer TaxID=2078957 RepID=UPI00286EE54D|nr:uncharacterized protein LOC132200959 [Neocloeon triangulifer]
MKSLLVVVVAVIVNSEAAVPTGESCEIKSAAFSDYLYLSAGWVSQNPILWPVRPQLASRRKMHGKWRIEAKENRGKTFYRLWNHGAETFLVAKGDGVGTRKTSGGKDSDLLWKIEALGASEGATLSQDGEFLVAKEDKAGEERELKMGPRSNKKSAKWVINC